MEQCDSSGIMEHATSPIADQYSEPNRKLRWYQYSLRTLLVVMTLFAIACSWFAVRMQRAKRQKETVAALIFGVIYDYEYDPASYDKKEDAPLPAPSWLVDLLGIDFFADVVSATATNDADLERLKCLPKLEHLVFSPEKPGEFTEAGTKAIAEMNSLRSVSFGCRAVKGTIDVVQDGMGEADFRILAGCRQITDLNFNFGGGNIDDEGLKYIADLSHLKSLNLSITQISGVGLKYLKELPELEDLSFQCCGEFSDVGMKNLNRFPALRYLDLEDTGITDAGLSDLAGLVQLQYLNIGMTKITGVGLSHLTGLKQLKSLNLEYSQISDEGLKHFQGLTVQRLILDANEITDSGLKYHADIHGLQGLSLSETHVTDAGLEVLMKFKTLRWLSIQGTQVTDAGKEHFQNAMPNVKISNSYWDWHD